MCKWIVPLGDPGGTSHADARDPASVELVHDDDLVASALCALLDGLEWSKPPAAVWTTPIDPLQ